MKDKLTALREINVAIGEMESQEVERQRDWFGTALATDFAFRRASTAVEGRDKFLGTLSVKSRRTTEIESIELFGEARAIVRAVVTVHDGVPQRFHNLRLFIHTDDGWKLLGWANEGPLPDSTASTDP